VAKIGITIHYRFIRSEEPEYLMKEIEENVKKLGVEVIERGWNKLILLPHPKCESITLHWHKWKTIKARKEDWDYERETMKKFEEELDDDAWICAGFTKTQYAGVKAHMTTVEILRKVGSRCTFSIVSDEADYYETGFQEESIDKLEEEFGESTKMIEGIGTALKEMYGKDRVITGSDLGGK